MATLPINLEIPDVHVDKARAGFLEIYPNLQKNEDESPKYNDKEWIELKIQEYVNMICRQGWNRIRDREAVTVEDIFTE